MKTKQQQTKSIQPKITWLTYLVTAPFILSGCIPFNALARDYFNPAMLEGDTLNQGNADLTIFEEKSSQLPGIYRVDIYLNNELQNTHDIEFQLSPGPEGKNRLQPCLSVELLNEMGVQTDGLTSIGDKKTQCIDLNAIPHANFEFRFNAQQLLLSIPQAIIIKKARGYVAENQWDEGISAALLNYSMRGANYFARNTGEGNNDYQYINLRPGINLGAWRLRNYSAYSRDSKGHSQWDSVYTYAKRNIRALKSQLTLGDSSSENDVFDSVSFRGINLASDDDMMPDSLKGYAPIVRGIARTNAQVIIRQNGYTIYQTNVAPGAFVINDMFPTGSSGDLHVTIKEADGSEQYLVVPFASLPILQREGQLKFNLTSGQYRSYDSNIDKTLFSQGTAIYGLPSGFTVYGGGQFANHYQSLSLGIGKNLGSIGAISVDAIQAWSTLKNQPKENGQSWRIRYSKNIVQTGTNFSIAGYRYSTDGYHHLQEVMDTYSSQPGRDSLIERIRNRKEMTLTQTLSDQWGSLSLNVIAEDYWKNDRTMRSLGVGYNNSWNSISYGLNYSYNQNTVKSGDRNSGGSKIYDHNQLFSLNMSIPLNIMSHNVYATYSGNGSKRSGTTHNIGLNGTLLESNNLNWSVQKGYEYHGEGNNSNLHADYRGTYGELTAGYTADRNYQSLNYGLQGGIVAHQNGITFGQPLGETLALVKAEGASGVNVLSQTGVKTDWRGYAIVPYTNPYKINQVQLDTETLPENVDLTLASRQVMPTRGAVVQANFDTNIGQRVLMTLIRPNNQQVPFGATVQKVGDKSIQDFIVGDSSQVYLTGMQEKGSLLVTWGSDGKQQCKVNYILPTETSGNSGISIVNSTCR